MMSCKSQASSPQAAADYSFAVSNLAILFGMAIISYADRAILTVLLHPIGEEFQLSDRMLGLLGGAPFALCYALFGLPFARAADGGSRKKYLMIAFAIWTVTTAACGLAPGLLLLFLARMGVGVGEGGATPIMHAMVADSFSKDKRNLAFAVLTSASPLGTALALVGGAWMAAQFGWRTAFLSIAGLSLPIAIAALFMLREPPRAGVHDQLAGRAQFMADVRVLFAKPSFVLLLCGFTIYALFAYGPLVFIPTYMVRVLGLELTTAGQLFGGASVVGSLSGTVLGGIVATYAARRDIRWLMRIPASGILLACPIAIAAFVTENVPIFTLLITLMVALLMAVLPPIFSTVQLLCGSSRRSTATAVVMFALNAVGMTIGPLATGQISDLFVPYAAAESLRYSLVVMSLVLLPAGLVLLATTRAMARDAED